MIIEIDKTAHKKTVKEYLYSNLQFSSALVKKLKANPDGILVNKKHVTVRYQLSEGDILELACEDGEDDISESVEPVNLPLDIIYEDEHMIALNKPSGMPTHPSHNHHKDTLANALSYYFSKKSRPFVFRAINRLDADTSGIVLIAKSKHSAHLLAKELRAGAFEKVYIALLHGEITTDGTINIPIMRENDSTMLRCTDPSGSALSKPCTTKYKVIQSSQGSTLVYAYPITGRTHQLRVHFSSLGHPIFGDGLYGTTSDGSDYPRLALHCYRLCFRHPFTHEMLYLETSIPDIFKLSTPPERS